jgi:murein DD-endopeptidase MepM/ murein hydrolase activator NlpD
MKTISRNSGSDTNNPKGFFGRHMYVIAMASTVLVLGAVIVLSIILSKRKDEQVISPPPPSISFVMPLDEIDIAQEASLTKLVYNPTLKEWRTVNGVIFKAQDGVNIKAVAQGVVTKVDDTLLQGTVITIDHGNDMTSTYMSLKEEAAVEVGQTVEAGQVLGQASNRLKQYQHFEDQLYLEMREANSLIDPMTLLSQEV